MWVYVNSSSFSSIAIEGIFELVAIPLIASNELPKPVGGESCYECPDIRPPLRVIPRKWNYHQQTAYGKYTCANYDGFFHYMVWVSHHKSPNHIHYQTTLLVSLQVHMFPTMPSSVPKSFFQQHSNLSKALGRKAQVSKHGHPTIQVHLLVP